MYLTPLTILPRIAIVNSMEEMNMKTETRYIVRSTINPALVLCTNEEFMADGFYGPGHDIGAKFYKSRKAAEKVRGGYKITVDRVDVRTK
jgi:hypothetical protein